MDDQQIIDHITALADEEKQLEEQHVGTGLSSEEEQRLARIQVSLDQMWDLLRQRRALRSAGRPTDSASLRSADTVEGYRQ
ncbi:MAG: DUF2630 family protein [Acidimicrobiales bacterium]